MKRLPQSTPEEDAVWDAIVRCQHTPFKTMKGLNFSYSVVGNEIFVDRKDKSITRSTVNLAYRRAAELVRSGRPVAGPKMLGTFGASYLFPIFISLGIITPAEDAGIQLSLPLDAEQQNDVLPDGRP